MHLCNKQANARIIFWQSVPTSQDVFVLTHCWICEALVPGEGFGKNVEGFEVDDHHFNLLSNWRGLPPIRLRSGGPSRQNYTGYDFFFLIERSSPAHICKKKATRMVQSDSNNMSVQFNSVIGCSDLLSSLQVFNVSLLRLELFETNLMRNRGGLAAEENQCESFPVSLLGVL